MKQQTKKSFLILSITVLWIVLLTLFTSCVKVDEVKPESETQENRNELGITIKEL
jgi:hypothetical protein